MRAHATNWLELAQKVEDFRRDILPADELIALQQGQAELKQHLKAKADASQLKLSIESLEGVLRKTGGTFYPKRSLVEYVEFFLVAAIVILGIRAYFIQPFKIPTNSMWPSYNGMTGEVFAEKGDEPGFIGKGFRFITQLAQPKRVDAPISGEVRIPVIRTQNEKGFVPFKTVKGRKWLVLPTDLREYQLFVNDKPVSLRVPGDFDLDPVLRDAFFDGAETFPVPERIPYGQGVYLPTGKQVKAGERLLAFDVLTGDQLFVDRISYHFVKPSVGDGFVFRTKSLTRLHAIMPRMAKDQYYIKRLVGLPGDTLEINEPVLYRNGEPIEGSKAFEKNFEQVERYPGYRNEADFQHGVQVTVPEDRYYAMGDNSASSLDSRFWGSIPAEDVVGRPLFIYYPFTKHWGVAP